MMNDLLNNIGDNIRSERKSQNLTLDELGSKANLTRHTVMRIEQDGSCQFHSFLSIMKALNVKADDLIKFKPKDE